VPRADERRFLGLNRFLVFGNLTNGLPFATFGVSSGATPLGRNILSLYPLPNNSGGPYGANTYTEVLPADGDGLVFSMRLTHQITQSNALNARYNLAGDNRVLPSVNRSIRSTVGSNSRSQNLSLILDSDLASKVSSLARFSFGRTRLKFPEYPTAPFVFSGTLSDTLETEFGPQRITSTTGPIGELIIEPFSPVGVNATFFPQGRVNNTFQYAHSLSLQWGDHSFKFGGDLRRIQLNNFQDRLYRPLIVFSNGVVRRQDSFQDPRFTEGQFFPAVELAALGLPSSILQTITTNQPDSTIGLRITEYNFFFNDIWRLRSNINIDLGIRYEYNTVPREVNNRIEDSITLRNLPGPDSSTIIFPEVRAAFDATLDSYRKIVGGRQEIYEPDRNNFGPHVGFAWDPWSDGKASVRAGYGIYYDTILGAVVSQSRNVFPREIPININAFYVPPDFIRLLNPPSLFFSFFSPRTPLVEPGTLNQLIGGPKNFLDAISSLFFSSSKGNGLAFTLPDKHLPTPYAQQWHLTVEREILGDFFISAAYVGTKGTKLTRLTTPNLGPNVTPNIPFVTDGNPPTVVPNLFESSNRFDRPIPALGPFQIFESSASSTYHALQLEARKRYSKRYTFTAAYTWSHALDDVSDLFPIAGAPVIAQDHKNFKLERGDANFDVRQRFVASCIWDMPFYSNSTGILARWLGGWQVAAIVQSYTGQPFTLNVPVDANLDGNLSDRPSKTEGLIFFKGHGARRVGLPQGGDVSDFFEFGTDGAVARNTVRGDGFVNIDLALNKDFRLSDNQGLEFRAEFFNLLNRANFGLPIRTLGAPGFGSAVDTIGPARLIQFALKYKF
jgi:hypothetical protein